MPAVNFTGFKLAGESAMGQIYWKEEGTTRFVTVVLCPSKGYIPKPPMELEEFIRHLNSKIFLEDQ